MTGRDCFRIWAPAGAKWTDWVRPVPFAAIGESSAESRAAGTVINTATADIFYLTGLPCNTALIIDLPGCESICEALALSKLGFRPVPLFNGTNPPPGAMAIVDNTPIEAALIWGASILEGITLPDDAPPAFLLDSNRLHRFKMDASVFDNSWDLYEQDIPSAEYFLENGISNITVRSNEKIQKDLAKILYKFRKKGIKILFTNGFGEPKTVSVRKPIRQD